MDTHKNAPLTPKGRLRLVEEVASGRGIAEVAEAFCVDRKTVRKWVARFGAPPKDVEGTINWIEKIPFAETRNYVQRVIENLQVYRARRDSDAPLMIVRDVTR